MANYPELAALLDVAQDESSVANALAAIVVSADGVGDVATLAAAIEALLPAGVGDSDGRPDLEEGDAGRVYFDTDVEGPIWWDGTAWLPPSPAVATDDRPTLAAGDAGRCYFDTDLGLPVWWDGSGWVDATGADPDQA